MMDESRRPVTSQPAEWLSFAATPTCALMAALVCAPQGGAHEVSCAAAANMPSLGGMVVMYGLMSAFHCRPWLKLISRWQSTTRASWLRDRGSDAV